MSRKLYFCTPDDEIHMALQTMKEGKVCRHPVIAKKGLSWVLFKLTTSRSKLSLLDWDHVEP
jgi:predicted transcriptional regulator